MLPFRAHLSIAIPALAFVLPAVIGVVIGGFFPGVVGAVGGFLLYDWFFLPPYNTFTVRSPSNWIALAVYAVVVLIVARVVDKLREAREEALRRTDESERLFELSQALIGDLTLSQLLTHIAGTRANRFLATLDRTRAAGGRERGHRTRRGTERRRHGRRSPDGDGRGIDHLGWRPDPVPRARRRRADHAACRSRSS